MTYSLLNDTEGLIAVTCWLLVCVLVYMLIGAIGIIGINVLVFGGMALAERIVGHRI